jgi:hypothetical protein
VKELGDELPGPSEFSPLFADFFGGVFESKPIELLNWQITKQIDSAIDLLGDFPKMVIRVLVAALKLPRIGRWPMCNDRLSGPNWATLSRVVAHGDDKIENNVAVLIPGFAARLEASILKSSCSTRIVYGFTLVLGLAPAL